MDISKKELIVTFFIDIILLLIVAACVIVLKYSFVSLCLAVMAVMFIFVSAVMTWMIMKQKRIDVERND